MKDNAVVEFKTGSMLGNTTPQSYRSKELISSYSIVIVNRRDPGEIRTIGKARCYMGRSKTASVVYATISVTFNGYHTHGHGSAGGGGYDKQSAAIGDAISNANIELLRPIHGRGESAIEDALLAIADYVAPGYYTHIVEA